jgi:hypothetical protein
MSFLGQQIKKGVRLMHKILKIFNFKFFCQRKKVMSTFPQIINVLFNEVVKPSFGP